MPIVYKKSKNENLPAISCYLRDKGLVLPENVNTVFYAEDTKDLTIKGVAGLINTTSFKVEPLAADNSFSAQVLLEKVLAIASVITDGVDVVVDAEKTHVISALEKSGFKIVDKNIVILRRDF
jgi:hypothetical protein